MVRLRSTLLVLSASVLLALTHTLDNDEAVELLRRGTEEYLKGRKSDALDAAFKVFQFRGLFKRTYTPAKNNQVCMSCNAIASLLIPAARDPNLIDELRSLMAAFCVGLGIQDEEACQSFIDIHIATVVDVMERNQDLTSERFCSIVFQNYDCVDPNRVDWTVDIPKKTHNTDDCHKDENNHYHRRPLKIMQLTDAHYSIDYGVGSNAVCGKPLCCEAPSSPSSAENAAGEWSDYRDCDLSFEVLQATMDHILKEHKDLDYVYYSGDIVDHKIWDTSIPRNAFSIQIVLDLIRRSFSIPVFPILGNHETHPVNVFAPHLDNLSTPTQWLFNMSVEEWSSWLPADTTETILQGGYYTVLVKPGFRVIGLNSNVCFIYNWWLLYDDNDPYDQLKWLVQVLAQAEKDNEIVHILSHIPSGEPTCLRNWAKEYSRIVARFSDTIAAQFNGHTHTIEQIIYFDKKKPVNVAFNGGSLTPYSYVNPNYAVYHVNRRTYEVDDYDVYIYDVNEANTRPEEFPRWFKLYSFKDAYNVNSLRPSDLYDLVKRMSKDCFLSNQFFRYKYKNAFPSFMNGCNTQCNYQNLCNLVTSYYQSTNALCERIQKELETC